MCEIWFISPFDRLLLECLKIRSSSRHYRDVDDLLTSGTQVEKLVVLHPAIVPVEAQLVYVAYNGWIYSGRSVLHVTKVSLNLSQISLEIITC